MKILQINWSDLVGRAFNGYDLHVELNRRGIQAKQLVLNKLSDLESVIEVQHDEVLHQEIAYLEKRESVTDLLHPYALQIANMECFQEADLVHYHILHGMVSLFDYSFLMSLKPSVMTIHDLWPLTGKCIHPLKCMKWKTECRECARENEIFYGQNIDNSQMMWNIKQNIYKNISPYFVLGSNFTYEYIKQSPAFQKKSSMVIPFGVDSNLYHLSSKREYRKKYKISDAKIVIGFRAENFSIKGCRILYKALEALLEIRAHVALLCVGSGEIPNHIRESFELYEFGWVNNQSMMSELLVSCDIFAMPSLAETFGLMAIEAMAAQNAIVCFKGTILQEITNAPDCGIAVKKESESEFGDALLQLCTDHELRIQRSIKCQQLVEKKYQFSKYADEHIALYNKILKGQG